MECPRCGDTVNTFGTCPSCGWNKRTLDNQRILRQNKLKSKNDIVDYIRFLSEVNMINVDVVDASEWTGEQLPAPVKWSKEDIYEAFEQAVQLRLKWFPLYIEGYRFINKAKQK